MEGLAYNVIGIRGNIETRYGKLCREGLGPEPGYCVVYCGILNVSLQISAQAGYGYERRVDWSPSQTIQFWYWEIIESGGLVLNHYESFGPPYVPLDGIYYGYGCEYDKSNSEWDFFIENFTQSCTTVVSNDWANADSLNGLVWAAEIWNLEDDMAGTPTDSCNISECNVKIVGSNYVSFPGTQNEIHSDDYGEWGIDLLGPDSFNIWDKHPQP